MSSAKPGIADQTSIGFFWTVSQFLFSKTSGLISQLVLAYFLVPEEFGLVGMAQTVSAFAGLLQKFGISDVLIHRQKRFHLWGNAGFWLSVLVGIASALIMLITAPLAAKFFGEPKLLGLVAALSLLVFFQSISAVPAARLRSRMQFRLLAMINTTAAFVAMIMSILMARQGMGAYSIIVPQILMGIIRFVWLMPHAQLDLRLTTQVRRWKYLVGDAFVLLLTYLVITFTSHGDYIVLGRMYEAEVVGMYYFGFNLSTQAFGMLAGNLSIVLFPALSQLRHDTQRQVDAFFRAACSLVAIGMPICFLQAAVGDCLIHILFEPKWYPAIPLLQILSIGMAFRIVALPVTSLLKSQGRFLTQLRFFSICATIFMFVVWFGARWEALGVSVAVTAYSVGLGFATLTLGMSPSQEGFVRALKVFAGPVTAGTVAYLPIWYLASLIPESSSVDWLRLFLILIVSSCLYLVVIKLLIPGTVREIQERLEGLVRTALKRVGFAAQSS